MLRVGLTGELGSGKSTVLRRFAELGAVTMSSDEIARAMMRPGESVYAAIVEHFGPGVVLPDGELDRPALARLAFDADHSRVGELNALIHPAVLAEQERRIAELAMSRPDAIIVIESALIFSAQDAGDQPWRKRFDCIVVVTAPDEVKVQRYVERVSGGRVLSAEERAELEADAVARLRTQRIPQKLLSECVLIENGGNPQMLLHRTEEVFHRLRAFADAVQV